MWEELLAAVLLWKAGFTSEKEYNKILDFYFEKNPENEVLLELEYCSTDIEESRKIINKMCFQYYGKFKSKEFARKICEKIEAIYGRPDTILFDFADKANVLWENLPISVKYEVPLIELSYMNASQVKKQQERAAAIYRTMFDFYHKDCAEVVKMANRKIDIKEFSLLPSGTVSLDWEMCEILLDFPIHTNVKDFYSRVIALPIEGQIDFCEADFLIPIGNKRFDTWFSFNKIEGKIEFRILPINCAENAVRFVRDSFVLWTGGNNFGKRTRIGEFFTNIGEITIVLNNETGFVEWIDCGYGHYKSYNKNPHGVLAENLETFLEKLCQCSII